MSNPAKATEGGPILRPHEYDGIQEFDQKLPNWWLFTLYIFIALTPVYWAAFYHFGTAQTDEEKIDAKVALLDLARQEQMREVLAALDNDVLWEWSRDPGYLATGKAVYDQNCQACHGADLSAKMGGAPLPGLALNDGEWKYGGDPMDVFHLVNVGSPDVSKGMIGWGPVVGAQGVAAVTAYIMSFHEKGDSWSYSADAPDAPDAVEGDVEEGGGVEAEDG